MTNVRVFPTWRAVFVAVLFLGWFVAFLALGGLV